MIFKFFYLSLGSLLGDMTFYYFLHKTDLVLIFCFEEGAFCGGASGEVSVDIGFFIVDDEHFIFIDLIFDKQ